MQPPNDDDRFATATWTADEAYFQKLFRDWLRHVSRQRRFLLPLAVGVMAVGGALWMASEAYRVAGAAVAAWGLLGVAWHVVDRRRWLRRMRDDEGAKGPVTMEFTPTVVHSRGPNGRSETAWRAFRRVKLAEHGLFLMIGRGMHVYVPYEGLEPRDAAALIVERVAASASDAQRNHPPRAPQDP